LHYLHFTGDVVMATKVLAEIIPFALGGHGFRLTLEFKPADLWIGAYWATSTFSDMPHRQARQIDVWVCILPMLPIHLTFRKPFSYNA
jgi:hypothetical protein